MRPSLPWWQTQKRGRSYHDDLRPGYRKYLVGSHVLFYRVTNTDVVVVRILHQRMDVERHL
jgi:toxin ParE1/3/4